jgi:endo-1,4-beta-D-glucanase Y
LGARMSERSERMEPATQSGVKRMTGLLAGGAAAVTIAAVTLVANIASAAGETHPFPTHVTYQVGVLPSASAAARDAAVEKQYDSWKKTYLVHGCASDQYYVSTKGDDDAPNNGTVSEAQGYGMNIVPLMAGYDTNAKVEFDGMWNLVRTHRDSHGMMQWKLDGKTCKYADSGTPDGATDGDLDIGYGLILADKQWGGYTAAAMDWLAKFYAADVAPDGHLMCEDDGPTTDSRPSDWMLDHLRAFAGYDTAHDWNKVVTKTQDLIAQFTTKYSPNANLLSDFVVGANTTSPKPAPANYQENQPDNIVGYNSLRVPWHMGTDALLYGNPAIVGVATKESNSYQSHSGGDPKKVYPHTKLDGSAYNTETAEEAGDAVGPSAMAAGDQAWTDKIWNYLATNPFGDQYFGETIKMLVYIVMAGDYWSPVLDIGPTPTATATSSPTASPSPTTSPTGPPTPTTYEAENASISKGVVESNHAGFSGTGFVNYDNVTGSFVQWTVDAAAAGPATLTLRYSNGTTTNRPMSIVVNGATVVATQAFGSTTNWDTWKTATITAALNAGTNTIRATATTSNGGPNVDYLTVS